MKRIPKKAINFCHNPFNGVLMTRSVFLWFYNRKYHFLKIGKPFLSFF